MQGLIELPPERRPVFGIVPLGTANDFATGCGIPADPKKAFELCANGNLDGEPASLDNQRFEAVTGALRLVVPPGCALIRTAAPADA